jgi:haloalkane dehalogenase
MAETMTTPSGIEFVRTPEERFAELPDYGYEPRYVEVDGLRMAYVDVGGEGAPAILLLHGEPTWGFLYRRMIPVLVDAGYRCIVPDLVGFGRSDKPTQRSDYTYARHVAWTTAFADSFGLTFRSMFAQDWGGLIGLRVLADRPQMFETVAVGNTALPVGEGAGPGFDMWLEMSQTMDPFDCGALLQGATTVELTDAEVEAYRAPFPDDAYLAGAREFPALVPIRPGQEGVGDNEAAWAVLSQWTRPFLTLWCPDDPVLGGAGHVFLERVPGAAGQPHEQLRPGGHFIQEDRGEDVATAMVRWLAELG